jgi:hypothetical protein
VRSVQSPWFGINLDTGNFYTDDPYGDLARCAPYAVNVQVKVDVRRRGAKQGEPVDLTRLATILRDASKYLREGGLLPGRAVKHSILSQRVVKPFGDVFSEIPPAVD